MRLERTGASPETFVERATLGGKKSSPRRRRITTLCRSLAAGAGFGTLERRVMLLVGSGNQHKLEEIAAILGGLATRVVGIDVLGAGPDVEEDGTTFAANAEIKACEFARRALALPDGERPRWTIADDSGLCVDALGGAPGVRSARYGGPGATYDENNRKLLGELEHVPQGERGARFVCSICCVAAPASRGERPEVLFRSEGVCEGYIALAPAGAGGFGYDPIFVEATSGRTFAELPAGRKNEISHRARALCDLRAKLADLVAAERSG